MGYARTALLLAALTALFLVIGYMLGGRVGILIAAIFAIGTNAYAYWNSDKAVLRMHGAREVDDRSAPELYTMVERLAGDADLPMPRVYIIETDQPNAFATGRDPDHAAVAATTGLLRNLTSEEIAGVMAHELEIVGSHGMQAHLGPVAWAAFKRHAKQRYQPRFVSRFVPAGPDPALECATGLTPLTSGAMRSRCQFRARYRLSFL